MFCNSFFYISDEEEAILKEVNYYFNGIIGGSICVIGFIMNSITLLILRSMPEWKQMMNYLLGFLLIANNIFLATQAINILAHNFDINGLMMIIPNIVYQIEKTILTVAVFCTVGLAHQAYLLTWKYDEYSNICSSPESLRKQTLAYAFPIIGISLFINLPRWISYGVELDENGYKMVEKSLERNFYYVIYYENFVLNVLTVFVPITLLVFFNWSVYNFVNKMERNIDSSITKGRAYSVKTVDENKQKRTGERGQSQATLLIIIIILFISCHFPRCILKFSDGYPKQIENLILDTIGRILLITYASATPFIYLTKSTKFRSQFFRTVNMICCCRRVSSYKVDKFSGQSTIKSQKKAVNSKLDKIFVSAVS